MIDLYVHPFASFAWKALIAAYERDVPFRACVVDPETREATYLVFFAATVTLERGDGSEQVVRIVGEDEIDSAKGKISWKSPLARALIKARDGDIVRLNTPEGAETIEILAVEYIAID